MRVLFILKKSRGYSGGYSQGYNQYNHASGLHNSAKYVVDMLCEAGIDAKLVHVNDNNDIDREVTLFRPHTVIIEALWVVPEKFRILKKLHPRVEWIVRIHSKIAFLAHEGIAVEWISGYLNEGVQVAFNSRGTQQEFAETTGSLDTVYLPNYFPLGYGRYRPPHYEYIDVGCFGAIRPLKNQLIQAMAAIEYAERHYKILRFHINATRRENYGADNILKNIRALFKDSPHELIEHTWMKLKDFQDVLSQMDVSLCVSLSETFCLVAADSVSLNIPLVCSGEILWASRGAKVNPYSMEDIVQGIERVIKWSPVWTFMNRLKLAKYNKTSRKIWLEFFLTDWT